LHNQRALALVVNDDDAPNHDVLYARRTGVRQIHIVLPAQTKILGFFIFWMVADEF